VLFQDLTPYERYIVSLRCHFEEVKDIADHLGLPVHSISRVFKDAREKVATTHSVCIGHE